MNLIQNLILVQQDILCKCYDQQKELFHDTKVPHRENGISHMYMNMYMSNYTSKVDVINTLPIISTEKKISF